MTGCRNKYPVHKKFSLKHTKHQVSESLQRVATQASTRDKTGPYSIRLTTRRLLLTLLTRTPGKGKKITSQIGTPSWSRSSECSFALDRPRLPPVQ